MPTSTEYKSTDANSTQTKKITSYHFSNVNFNDSIIKNHIILLSLLIINFIFLLITICGASSGSFIAKINNITYSYGYSNRRQPTFINLYNLNYALASAGAFYGFIIIISWLFIISCIILLCLYLFWNSAQSFQIGKYIIHQNHIIFYGILIIEVLLLIAIIAFHGEFSVYMNNTYNNYSYMPSYGMWFSYFSFILLIISLYFINDVQIELINKHDEEIKINQSSNINHNNINNNNNNNNNNNKNIITNYNNINNNDNNNNNVQNKTQVTVNNNNNEIYDSDDEELGIKLRTNQDTNTIDIDIEDDDEHDKYHNKDRI
jgi:hypothetical protein